jgi:hypothetical protein
MSLSNQQRDVAKQLRHAHLACPCTSRQLTYIFMYVNKHVRLTGNLVRIFAWPSEYIISIKNWETNMQMFSLLPNVVKVYLSENQVLHFTFLKFRYDWWSFTLPRHQRIFRCHLRTANQNRGRITRHNLRQNTAHDAVELLDLIFYTIAWR